jgi:hypothetical protein
MLYVKVKNTVRPYSGEIIGRRIVVAVNNNSGHPKFDKTNSLGNRVSFKKPYLVAESSDLMDVGNPEVYLMEFLSNLGMGEQFEMVGG